MMKRKPYRNKKILAHARGQQCTCNSPDCNYNTETVVAAHSDCYEDGKGTGQKADDFAVAFMCSGCHDWIHSYQVHVPKLEKRDYFHRAMKRTLRILFDDGIIK